MSHPANKGLQLNKDGRDLIKKWEGFHKKLPDGRCQAYLDKLAAKKYWSPGYNGLWTIGYGCTEGVTEGMIWTREQAERWLDRELDKHEMYVEDMVDVPLNPNQFSALVSLSYNMGPANLRSSSLLRELNAGNYTAAGNSFKKYTRAGGKVYKGLVNRRKDEADLFRKLPKKELIQSSRKLTMLERLRMLIPIGGAGTWLSWENLAEVRQFLTDYSGFIALGMGLGLWAIFKMLENKTIQDYEAGRYVPSGVANE